MDYENVIKKSELFTGLDDTALDYALDFFQASVKHYKKGDFLQLAGTNMPHFGLVLDGTVQVYMDDINGNQMIMATVQTGDTFGESLCYLKVNEVPIYICAVSDCAVMWLHTDKLQNACASGDARMHDLVNRFISMLALRTLAMNNRVQILSKSSIRSKLVALFSQHGGSHVFTVPFDRSDMATYLGTERSALSRELSRLKREGYIDYHKNSFRILKPIE